MRILFVEDNRRLAALVGEALKSHSFAVDIVGCADDAEAAMRSTSYDSVVLDLGLPDRDGMTVLALMRRKGVATPVLVLTSRDSSQAIIDGLNGGADDYLLKPFVMDELIARIRALLRRPGRALGVNLRIGNIELDTVKRRARIEHNDIELSRRELGALERLMRGRDRVISKAEMEESLYGYGEEVSSNAVEVLVHRLRKKLQAASANADIYNLRGLGYMLSDRSS
jgi:DNA-binding response OmpR family regulator